MSTGGCWSEDPTHTEKHEAIGPSRLSRGEVKIQASLACMAPPGLPRGRRWTRLLSITGLRNVSPGKRGLTRCRRGPDAVMRSDAAGRRDMLRCGRGERPMPQEAPEIRAPSDRMRSPPGGVLGAPVQGQWDGQVGLRRLVCTRDVGWAPGSRRRRGGSEAGARPGRLRFPRTR